MWAWLQVEGAAAKEKLETLESQNVCACSLYCKTKSVSNCKPIKELFDWKELMCVDIERSGDAC